VPVLSRIAVDGRPVTLDAAQARAASEFVRSWYVRHVALDSGRSSTWTTGHGVARMIGALDGADPQPWPAAVLLDGAYGISGVALTVPVTLGRDGAGAVHEWDLAPDELAALRRAAEAVRAATAQISRSRPAARSST